MDNLGFWRLCSELSVHHAAMLIAGLDPSGEHAGCDELEPHQQPLGYQACSAALKNAILSGELPATIRRDAWMRGYDEELREGVQRAERVEGVDVAGDELSSLRQGKVFYRVAPNWRLTTVTVDDLKQWLTDKNFHSEFFATSGRQDAPYLDPSHPRYSAKLAATVSAWLNTEEKPGKSPKQWLEKWLREHADQYGMKDASGVLNQTAIEECAKVANWKPQGGASSTPN